MDEFEATRSSTGRRRIEQTSLLLANLESPINIGQILRTADVFGLRVYVSDGPRVLKDAAKRRMVRDFSCGALDRAPPVVVDMDEIAGLLGNARGIATSIDEGARPLDRFHFRPSDLIVLGNEYRGIHPSILELCLEKMTIPMPKGSKPKPRSSSPISSAQDVTDNGLPCLNVGAAAAIIAFACFEQSTRSTLDGAPGAAREVARAAVLEGARPAVLEGARALSISRGGNAALSSTSPTSLTRPVSAS